MSSAVDASRTHAAEAAAQVSSGIPTLVLQMLGIQMSPPGATVTTLPPQYSQLEAPHLFYTSDNQFVVSCKLESVAASNTSFGNGRGDKNVGVSTNTMSYETCHIATPETSSSVHNNQHIVGNGKTWDHTKNTGKEAPIQVDNSCFSHDVIESGKVQTPNTAAATAETTTATTARQQTQKLEAIPVQEKQSLPAPVPETGSSDSETIKHSHSAEVLSRYRRLLAQNRELKRRQLCRKCRRTPANVTLLPCGHLLYCQGCADDLTHCGACQKEILAEVKTYLC